MSSKEQRYKTSPGLTKSATLMFVDEAHRRLQAGAKCLLVVEGPFDATSLHQVKHAAVATMGGSLSVEQSDLVRRILPAQAEVHFVPDNGKAGLGICLESVARLGKVIPVPIKVRDIGPKFDDIADYLAAGHAVPKPVPIDHYVLDVLASGRLSVVDAAPAISEYLKHAPPASRQAVIVQLATHWKAPTVMVESILASAKKTATTADLRQVHEMGEEYREFKTNAVSAVGTGIVDIDTVTGGIWPGELAVIVARPGVTRTTLAMNILRHVSVTMKEPALFISLEMTSISIFERFAQMDQNLNRVAIEVMPRRTPNQYAQLLKDMESRFRRLRIVDRGGVTLDGIRDYVAQMTIDHGTAPRLVVVDYLQLLRIEKAKSLYEKTTELAQGAKALAKALGVAVIALCQASRGAKDVTEPLKLSDCRDSGAIEESADLVLGLHLQQEKHFKPNACGGLLNHMHVTILKSRRGGLGEHLRLRLFETMRMVV